jgi:hypothetical protein
LLAPAQILHRAHIAFVECGENRRGVLCHHQLLRDFATQRRHLYANEASFAAWLHFARFNLFLRLRHGWLGWFSLAAVFHRLQHIGFR